jgi:hypothetical protein
MSKYGTKNNENFSKPKYFANSSNANNTVIRKNLLESPTSINTKYTQNIYAKPVNQENFLVNKKHSEPLSSVTRANKYNIIEKPMIQKRDSSHIQKSQYNIQKAEGIWGNLTDWFKNFLDEQKKQRDTLYGIAESGTKSAKDTAAEIIGSVADAKTKIDARSLTPPTSGGKASTTAPSGSGAVTAAREGATRTPKFDINLLRRDFKPSEYPIWEDSISSGDYRGTVHPDQFPDHLAEVNPAASDALWKIRERDGTSMAEPISESEALELLDFDRKDYTSAAFEPGWEPSPSLTSADNRFARLYSKNEHPEDMLDSYYDAVEEFEENRKPWGQLTPDEREQVKLGMDEYYNDVVVPAKFEIDDIYDSEYLSDKKPKGIATEAKESTPEVPVIASKITEQKDINEINDALSRTSSVRSSDSKTINPRPSDGDISLPKISSPWVRPSSTINMPLNTEIPVLNQPKKQPFNLPVFDTLDQPKLISNDDMPKEKKKKLSNKQRLGLAATALTAAGVAHHFATKPTTTIPNIPKPINPTGNWKIYGNNKGEKVGSPEDWTDRWAPGTPGTPSNDFWRPLVQGYKGGTPEYQIDKEGDYMYVRSPYPYAPNDTSQNRKNRKLTTRGREEMWRFGGDLQDVPANKWGGKWDPIPDDK